jgi:hypothetical protein
MHRIWEIPEIVEEIVSWLNINDRDHRGQRALAALARTARLFARPATTYLWADVSVGALCHLTKVLKVRNMAHA